MSKNTPAAEAESPVLVNDWDCDWVDQNYFPWACVEKLAQLFDIDGAEKINFVAKSRADTSTYRIELSKRSLNLKKPLRATLYHNLARWLAEQIAAGRPHIGVRIVHG